MTHASASQSANEQSLFTQLAGLLNHYASVQKTGKVVEYQNYSTLKNKLQSLDIGIGNQSWDSVWATVETYLDNSVKTSHPQYFNQLWAGQSEPALVGSVIEAIANTSMYTYEVCLLYTSPSPRDRQKSRMPSSA